MLTNFEYIRKTIFLEYSNSNSFEERDFLNIQIVMLIGVGDSGTTVISPKVYFKPTNKTYI